MKNQFVTYEIAKRLNKIPSFKVEHLAEYTVLKNKQILNLNQHFFTNEKIAPNVPAPLWQQAIEFVHRQLNKAEKKEIGGTVELILLADGSCTWSFAFDNIYCKTKEELVAKALDLLKM